MIVISSVMCCIIRGYEVIIYYYNIKEEYIECIRMRLMRGIYSMLQVYLLVTILIETCLIRTIYHQPY